jgi:hypothetical protein
MEGAYFNGFYYKILKALYAPLVYSYLLFTVHKDGMAKIGTHTRQHQLSPNAFKGKIYVMINGGSFSASSLISSNLKTPKE